MRSAFFPDHNPAVANQWLSRDWLMWSLLWLLAVVISRFTDIDMMLTNSFYDPVAQTFPLRNEWLWDTGLHKGAKHFSTLAWVLLLIATVHARWQGNMARYQPLVFVLVSSALALMVNGLLKGHSSHSCPWALNEYGGSADYFRLLAATPINPGPGHCLPSGHAGVAFMWWPVVYACARWRPQWRWPAALLVLAFGVFCSYVQIARGAHLLSHVLIAAAVCGSMSSLTYHLPDLRKFFTGASKAAAQGA